MTKKNNLSKSNLVLPVSLVQPDERAKILAFDKIKSIASKSIFDDLKSQEDLLYTKSILVTVGMNANDDVFLPDETWKARSSPILKPLNENHSDSDIVGVIYSVSALDLDGQVLDFDSETHDKPFELCIEGVLYHYTFPDRIEALKEQYEKGELFVSMEAWYDSYDYAIYHDDVLETVVGKNSETAFLDNYLRATGGCGFIDVAGKNKRIGRALRSVIFGGCGFVKVPANSRSVIHSLGDFRNSDDSCSLEELLRLNNSRSVIRVAAKEKELIMDKDKQALTLADLQEAVRATLEDHQKYAVAKAEAEKLQNDFQKSVAERNSLAETNERIKADLEKAQTVSKQYEEAFNTLFTEIVGNRSVKAQSGDEALREKIALFQSVSAELKTKASAAETFEQQLIETTTAMRKQEVESLFASLVTNEALARLQERAVRLSSADYADWITDQQVLLAAFKPKEEMKDEKKKKEEKEEAGQKFLQTDFGLQGAMPNAATLRNPRHKIAGEADATDLDSVEVQSTVNLAGATAGQGDDVHPVVAGSQLLAKTIGSLLNPSKSKKQQKGEA